MKRKSKGKKCGIILMFALLSMTFIGCATARKINNFAKAGVDAVVSVKDPVFNTVDKVIDAAEGVKNAATGGAKDAANAATQ